MNALYRRLDVTECGFLVVGLVLVALAWVIPGWLMFLLTISLAKALVVLGVVLQMRAGLVSFGQALFYSIGGYGAGMGAQMLGINDAFLLLIIGVACAVVVAMVCGLLLSKYRDIFFAMLTLALSMILYGVLVKSSFMGSTDGFNVPPASYVGWVPTAANKQLANYLLAVGLGLIGAIAFHKLIISSVGGMTEAVRENEVRVDYLGLSPQSLVFVNYVSAAAISALGGGLTALATGHVDPDMAFWTTSGEFVFIAILGGTGHVAAPFVGALVFSAIRTYAIQEAPNTWQMTLGVVLLVLVLFLPKGLWSLGEKFSKGVKA